MHNDPEKNLVQYINYSSSYLSNNDRDNEGPDTEDEIEDPDRNKDVFEIGSEHQENNVSTARQRQERNQWEQESA